MNLAGIFVGWKGPMLAQRLNGLCKLMIDICGKPLVERHIHLLKRYRFRDI